MNPTEYFYTNSNVITYLTNLDLMKGEEKKKSAIGRKNEHSSSHCIAHFSLLTLLASGNDLSSTSLIALAFAIFSASAADEAASRFEALSAFCAAIFAAFSAFF